jgi:hypothetical protein
MTASATEPSANRIRPRSKLPWVVLALDVLLVAAAWAFGLLNTSAFNATDATFLLVEGLAALAICFVGGLILGRQPANVVGWIFVVSSLGLAVQGAGFDYVSLSADRYALGLPATLPVAWVDNWLMVPSLISLVILVPLYFPTGRLPSPRWRPVGAFAVFAITVVTLGSAFAPGPMQSGGLDNPLTIDLGHPLMDVLGGIDAVSGLLLFALTAAAVVVRYRHGTPLERLQLRWFAYPATLAIVGIGFSNIVTTGVASDIAWIGGLLCVAAMPLAVGIAILRHRLFDIDLVIKRTLSYAVLSLLLIGVEVGGILVLQQVLTAIAGEQSQTLAVAVTTLGVAALFQPARRRIQGWVDRRFYRARYDAEQILATFAARLRDEVELDAVTADLCRSVEQAMRPSSASVWLRADESA